MDHDLHPCFEIYIYIYTHTHLTYSSSIVTLVFCLNKCIYLANTFSSPLRSQDREGIIHGGIVVDTYRSAEIRIQEPQVAGVGLERHRSTRGTSKPRASKTAREGVDQFHRVGMDRSGSGKIFQIGQERRFGLFHQLSYLRMISSALGHRARNQVIVPGFIIIPGGHHVARSEFSEIHAGIGSVWFGLPHR